MDTQTANLPFSDFGEMEFDNPQKIDDKFSRGIGKFWNVNRVFH